MADEQLKQARIPKTNVMHEHQHNVAHAPIAVKEENKPLEKVSKTKENEKKEEIKKDVEETAEEKKEEKGKEAKKTDKKVRKYEASVYGRSLNVSLKHSIAIGNFIKNRKIEEAISNLEKVISKKIAIPFKGELAHRRGLRLDGKKMMSGKYPINASKEFVKLLKNLSANSSANGMDLDKTIIYEVIPNKAPKQHHRFGSTVFKRTHIIIKSKEITNNKSKK